MADEKKTYLVNVESNLPKYAEEAAKAKEEVDKLVASNKALKESGTASAEEIEASNAALRNAQKEYSQAKKMVDLQTAANKSEINSRKQLGEIIQIEMQRLGKLGNAYTINAQGQRTLSREYIEGSKRLADAKNALITYDQQINDGRSNVGRYGQAVNEAFKNAGESIMSMVGPMALVTAGIALATKIFNGLKEALISTTKVMDTLNIYGQVTKQIFYDIVTSGKLSIEAMREAGESAVLMNEKRKGYRQDMVEFAILEREIAIAEFDSANKTKTLTERQVALNLAISKQNELSDKKIINAKEGLRIDELNLQRQPENEKYREQYAKDLATIIRLDTERFEQSKWNEGKVTKMQVDEAERIKKQREDLMELADEQIEIDIKAEKTKADAIDKDFDRWSDYWDKVDKKLEEEKKEAIKKEKDDFKRWSDYWDRKDAYDAVRENANIEAGFEYQRLKAEGDLNLLNTILDQEYGALLTSVEYERMTANQKLLIDEQYTQAKKELSAARIDQLDKEKLMVAAALGAMSALIGEETAVGKAFAIAQATINTWVAASQALRDPTMPSVIMKIAAMVAIISAGLVTVANIIKVKIPGGRDVSSSVPVSIASSVPAMRSFATPVGSSILTQPQLSQTQLNAIPQQGLLTAEDIANALSKMPSPVVTVEDINAKVISKRKVDVRGTI